MGLWQPTYRISLYVTLKDIICSLGAHSLKCQGTDPDSEMNMNVRTPTDHAIDHAIDSGALREVLGSLLLA